jgi:hypothetical protein
MDLRQSLLREQLSGLIVAHQPRLYAWLLPSHSFSKQSCWLGHDLGIGVPNKGPVKSSPITVLRPVAAC